MVANEMQHSAGYSDPANDADSAVNTMSDVQIEDSHFRDADSMFIDQDQAGDEEAVEETHVYSSEPHPDGSETGQAYYARLPEESRPSTVAFNTWAGDDELGSHLGSKLLERPKSAGKIAMNDFTFSKHNQPSMDMQGTRKGRAANTMSTGSKSIELTMMSENLTSGTRGLSDICASHNTAWLTPISDASESPDGETGPKPSAAFETSSSFKNTSASDEQMAPSESDPSTENERKQRKPTRTVTALEYQPGKDDDVAPPLQQATEQDGHVEHQQLLPHASDILEGVRNGSDSEQKSEVEPHVQHRSPSEKLASSRSSQQLVSPEELTVVQQKPLYDHSSASAHSAREEQMQHSTSDSVHADRGRVQGPDLHRVSDSHGNSRVSKPKTKHSQKAVAQTQVATPPADDPLVDINDYMQVAWFKINQLRQRFETEAVHERETFELQLQQVCEVRDTLQDQLDLTLRVKESQAVTINEQAKKIADYGLNVKRFKVFIDGLGNDINSLKRDAATHSRKREELRQQVTDLEEQRESLRDQLSTWETRTANLKTEMAETCSKAQTESENAAALGKYLEQQLSEKVGMLAEERDRRSQLEKQLALRLSSEGEVKELLADSRNAILDKVTELCTNDRETQGSSVSGALKKILEGMQALDSRAGYTVEELTTTKDLIEQLKQK